MIPLKGNYSACVELPETYADEMTEVYLEFLLKPTYNSSISSVYGIGLLGVELHNDECPGTSDLFFTFDCHGYMYVPRECFFLLILIYTKYFS